MFRTIRIGAYIQVQGELVRVCRNGEIIIRDGSKQYRGWPVNLSA